MPWEVSALDDRWGACQQARPSIRLKCYEELKNRVRLRQAKQNGFY